MIRNVRFLSFVIFALLGTPLVSRAGEVTGTGVSFEASPETEVAASLPGPGAYTFELLSPFGETADTESVPTFDMISKLGPDSAGDEDNWAVIQLLNIRTDGQAGQYDVRLVDGMRAPDPTFGQVLEGLIGGLAAFYLHHPE